MGTYTDLNKVNDFLNIEITESTKPNSDYVDRAIAEIEAEMQHLALGSYAVTDKYIDVPGASRSSDVYSRWVYVARTDQLIIGEGQGTLIPLHDIKDPVVSVTSLSKNDEDPQDTASWDSLTEGPADGSSYLLLQNNDLGYALWFYDNYPLAGPKRLKMSYNYGYNIDSNILQEYATLKVSEKVLISRWMAADPVGVKARVSPSFGASVNDSTQYVIKYIRERCREIEERYFPNKPTAVGIL